MFFYAENTIYVKVLLIFNNQSTNKLKVASLGLTREHFNIRSFVVGCSANDNKSKLAKKLLQKKFETSFMRLEFQGKRNLTLICCIFPFNLI